MLVSVFCNRKNPVWSIRRDMELHKVTSINQAMQAGESGPVSTNLRKLSENISSGGSRHRTSLEF
jgi:hypothetical protein